MKISPKKTNANKGISRRNSLTSILDSNIGINVEFTDNRQPPVVWQLAKFDNRLYIMRDMYNAFTDVYDRELEQLANAFAPENDPFWDPPEPQMIGKALIYMDSLSFLLEIEEGTPIIDFKGKQQGELVCEVIPTQIGNKSLIDNYEEHELENYMGEDITLQLRMVAAKGLPNQLCNNVYLRYSFFGNRCIEVTSEETKSMAPKFDFSEQIIQNVDEDFIDYVKNEAFEIEVWGSPDEVVYTAGIGQGEKYATMSAAQLRQELEKEQMERRKIEARLKELEEKGASKQKEDLVKEIQQLKRQLKDAKKSTSCVVS